MSSELLERFPVLRLAYQNLSRNRFRSLLAAVTIMISVLAIASLGIFGTSIQIAAASGLGELGNELVVYPAFEEGVESLDEQDIREIELISNRATVVPIRTSQKVVGVNDDQTVTTVRGMGKPNELYDARDGRIPDRYRDGALVGSDLADRLDIRAGQQLQVGNETYYVTATLESESAFSPIAPNQDVILPEDEVDGDGYSAVAIRTETGDEASELSDRIEDAVNDREERAVVLELKEVTEVVDSFFDSLNVFLVGLGAISLLVAGISILNVMLMSIIERKKEIGVLRATGIHKREVIKLIIIEAGLLGLLGSAAGSLLATVIGLLVSYVILGSPLAGFNAQSLLYLLFAVTVGIATSALSGVYPAWKAVNERPVDTLQD